MKKGKIKIGLEVCEESYEAFKRAVLNKWGKIHGALGDELSRAMNAYCSNHMSHTPLHAHTQCMIKFKGMKVVEAIFATIRRRFKSELTENSLLEAIRKEAGTDDRTVRKYRTLLVNELGWLKVKVLGAGRRPTIYTIEKREES